MPCVIIMDFLKTPTFWFSLWGGITGTLAILFTWSANRKDKPKLKIDASLNRTRDKLEEPLHWQLEINFRNAGRRPCYVDRVDLEFPPAESFRFGDIKLDLSGPIRMSLYNSKKHGVISLNESQKNSIGCKLSEATLQMLAGQLRKQATLLIHDSLGTEYTCNFNLPSKEHIPLGTKEE